MYPDEFENMYIDNLASFDELDTERQVAYCLFWLETEVNNGGFHQFFSNSSGLFTVKTLDSLQKIGAVKSKILLQRAIEICYRNGFPLNPLMHDSELNDLDEVSSKLEAIDIEFQNLEEPLADLVNSYLREAK